MSISIYIDSPRLREYALTKYAGRVGQDAIIACRVHSYPEPEVTWSFKGREIKDGPDYEIINGDHFSTLRVKQITEQDLGTYKCAASNKEGQASFHLQLLKPGEI